MSKILKNTTASAVDIIDVGLTVPASGQLTIQASDDLLFRDSSDVVTLVGNGTLVVNDGTNDLSITEGIDLIKGIFPNPIALKGSTDSTVIGNIGDQLKTRSNFGPEVLTAFGRLKASLPTVIYEYNFTENERLDLFDTSTSTGGTITYDSQEAVRELNVTATSGSEAI